MSFHQQESMWTKLSRDWKTTKVRMAFLPNSSKQHELVLKGVRENFGILFKAAIRQIIPEPIPDINVGSLLLQLYHERWVLILNLRKDFINLRFDDICGSFDGFFGKKRYLYVFSAEVQEILFPLVINKRRKKNMRGSIKGFLLGYNEVEIYRIYIQEYFKNISRNSWTF